MIGNFKIGFLASGNLSSIPFEDVCDFLAKAGYDAVEPTLSHFCPIANSIKALKSNINAAGSYGLEISQIVVQQDYMQLVENLRQDAVNYTIKCIETYSELGLNTINVFTGPRPWIKKSPEIEKDITKRNAWDMLYDAFDKLVKSAEKFKVNLAVENVWGMLCNDYFTLKPLIDHYNSPYLGVNFDPSHDVLAGNTDMGFLLNAWGNKIKHIHLKDAAGIQQAGKFVFPLLGEGFVNWKSFKKALEEIDYKGVLSIEFESFNYLDNILENDMKKAAEISFNLASKLFK